MANNQNRDVGTDRLRQRIIERVADCLTACEALPGAPLPDPQIRFDLRGRAAGQCQWKHGQRPVLRFNLAIAERYVEDFLENAVAHEVAHLAVVSRHRNARPHGPEWRAMMAHLGLPDAPRCHDYSLKGLPVGRQRRWTYRCGCTTHELSTTRHHRAQRDQVSYRCTRCGDMLRWETTSPGAAPTRDQ